ncbi:MAG: MurT ligase domain-containing protein [Candidatus Nomurabacteria bacterium]|jgi:UDP-N-acetylmuramyl tripeptide synthase|nr:MurT ligase domain-containing protein [Candidatus Nomurabacteria bacterium]
MIKKTAILAGKGARLISHLRGSGGSALPGLVAEKLQPNFLSEVFAKIPVVVVSGTNGKTTTAKIVTELLEDYGKKVFTNKTGSNFTRGITSAVLAELGNGEVFDFDIAVLELDEAHAVQFVRKVAPTYSLLLNVMRDQLDRFGEIDITASYLRQVAEKTTAMVVVNREDTLLQKIEAKNVKYFGYSKKIEELFPNDDELYGIKDRKNGVEADIVLEDYRNGFAKYNIGSVKLQLPGAHNALNAAGALALVKSILGKDFNPQKSLRKLAKIQAAFGRGEKVTVSDKSVELILVKNPSGFRIALASQNDKTATTMIAINDEYADGRDMSWLWDVDFRQFDSVSVVSGIRAYDMALRLQYDDVEIDHIEPNLRQALSHFLSTDNKNLQIYCTYTAMLKIRKLLSRITDVEKIL